MASVAIDPTEIRPTSVRDAEPQPAIASAPRGQGRRNAVVIAAGGAVVLCLVGAAGFAAYPHLPHSLSGLGIGGDGPKPKRSEIRIGKLPDMPEIRNGVPEIVKPVRVIATDGSPQAPAAPRPAETAGLKPTVPAIATAAPAAGKEPTISEILASDLRPAAANAPGAPVSRQSVLSPNPTRGTTPAGLLPPSKPTEPVATASILVDTPKTVPAPAALIPLPPAAPARTATVAAAPRPEKPADKPAAVATKPPAAAKPARTQTAAASPAPAPAAAPAEVPEEERVEILGVKLPNGNDFKRAVGSIGDAVTSLPQKF